MKDVATAAGVSSSTVSHLLNGTREVAPATAERIRQIMAELDYDPDALARSLRTKRTHMIGMLVSDITNPFFSSVVRGAEDAAANNGFRLTVTNTDEDPRKEDLCLHGLHRRRLDGFIIVPTGIVEEGLKRLDQRKVPFIFVDRKVNGIRADVVLSDNVEGAFQAVKHLVEKGHRRVAVILGQEGVTPSDERFLGYKKALEEEDLPLDEKLLVRGNFRIDGGREACHALLQMSKPPSAIFVTNNRMVIGALEAIRESGLRCPEHISVVGFDDFEWVALLEPPLTTVAQQPYQIGYQAMEFLMRKIADPSDQISHTHRVPCELIVRQSVARIEKTQAARKRREEAIRNGFQRKASRHS